jgi:hypothetical protein
MKESRGCCHTLCEFQREDNEEEDDNDNEEEGGNDKEEEEDESNCSSIKMFASKSPRLLRCRREGPSRAVLQVGGEE